MKERKTYLKFNSNKVIMSNFDRAISMSLDSKTLENEKRRANRLTQSLNDEVRSQVMSTIGFGWHIMKIRVKSTCIYVVYQDLFSENQLVQRYRPEVVTTWRKEDKPISKDSKYYQKGEDL